MLGRTRVKNLLTNQLFSGLLKYLNQSSDTPGVADLNVTHIAVGLGSTTPVVTDTALANELFRKAVTTRTRAPRSFKALMVLAESEGNGALKEIGVFANATGSAGSGTLLSRVLIDKVKNTNMTLNIYWKLTFE